MKSNCSSLPTLGIVVPCFNEEAVLLETTKRLISVLQLMKNNNQVNISSGIFFVDDGSADQTWQLIEAMSLQHSEVSGIRLSKNCGHQNALLCGLLSTPGDILISIDADLQDDLDVIPKMVDLFRAGFDIVYGVRKNRDTDSFFKRVTAEVYYKFMAAMNVDIVFNHADYRLLSRQCITALSEYREVNLFLRGLVRLLGFNGAVVEYDRAERFAGESKYPLRKMLSFAWQGVTSFSTAPLRMITLVGVTISIVSIGLALWGLLISLITDKALPGWASTVVPLYFLGGIQLLSLGVIGEYVSKIYMECKGRPRFQIRKLVGGGFYKEIGSAE